MKVGTIVRMTAKAFDQGLQGRAKSRYAVVAGNSDSPLGVIVRRDGLKRPESWYLFFWERVHINRRVFLRKHPDLNSSLPQP